MSGTYMRKLMEALERDGRLTALRRKLQGELESLKANPEGVHPGTIKSIENITLPKIEMLMQHGEPNSGNIVINPFKPRSKKMFGEEDQWVIQGDPDRVLQILKQAPINSHIAAIERSMEDYGTVGGEEITWREVYAGFRIDNNINTIKEGDLLLIGEGEDDIDDFRIWISYGNVYESFLINGVYLPTRGKFKQYIQEFF
jgi:hypothetical protein